MRQVVAAESAFCALRWDGRVVTWGRADIGGDSGAVQSQLRSVVLLRMGWGRRKPAENGDFFTSKDGDFRLVISVTTKGYGDSNKWIYWHLQLVEAGGILY